MKNDFKSKDNLITFGPPLPSHLKDLRTLWKEAFHDSDDFLDLFFETAFSTSRCRCAFIDDEAVAVLYWFDCMLQDKSVAYIYAVATSIDYRGRKICHRLMDDTHKHLAFLGYIATTLSPASEYLAKFYEHMGYKGCSDVETFSCDGAHISDIQNDFIRKIDKHEYASLRRKMLPSNGIIQEHESLDFLDAQASFYAGDGFLLAASNDDDISTRILNVLELLGDKEIAPTIVSALGYERGIFRCPISGHSIRNFTYDKTPHAMYLPLSYDVLETLESSPYLGFIFD